MSRMILRAMTYNLKNCVDDDFPPWDGRRPLVAEIVGRHAPQVIGTQEGFYRQVRAVAGDSSVDYEWIGLGRHGGSRNEFNAVLFDPAVLEPLEFDHFWLSETPDVVGSRTPSWGNDVVRMATWVRFATLTDGRRQEFVWLNTHLDHRAEEARTRGAALIVDRLKDFTELPVVVSGDFNCGPDSASREVFEAAGFADSFAVSAKPAPETGTCVHDDEPVSETTRIDWILVRPGTGAPITVDAAGIDDSTIDGQWPSDHVPVVADLRLD
jgi:endonuclease/exonuclease/phosphatase family metal-dependent hydrolase